jgi:two-component system, NtrC family, nitrogen regulation sensor histidine kinase NtrY
MIEQLSDSAERLARSERESAWREMAKQIAHEIKNPLTPMRLIVQHFQRSFNDDENKEEKVG